ncbi:MAG TPA: pantoate--beta-alanine ligase [Candidatus Contendobacter sp.]|nr:pantoate--beta-alanine ligase [Candidatus Contendobacter sp.]
MQTVHTIAELRAQVMAWKRAGEQVAFVPTMGNLHRGHIHLVECARELAPRTVASIFVNPMQFGPSEDFAAYPRTLDADSRQLETAGLDLLFAPSVAEVYPRPLEQMTQVTVPELPTVLCGASRPTHFSGVTTVVSKLFNMVQPDIAVFGEKDWQQLVIIRRMATDLDMPVAIVGVPTVREPDGLALSSRNGYLSAEERAIAPTLYATLRATAERLRAGERDFAALEAEAKAQLASAGFRPDYFEIRRPDDLQRPNLEDAELRIFAAAWLGRARLIDNWPVG